MYVISSLDSTMRSSKKQGFCQIRKGLGFCEVCGLLFIYASCYVHDLCSCVILGLMSPVKSEDMKHLNWSGMFLLLTPQHKWCYEYIALHQCCQKETAITSKTSRSMSSHIKFCWHVSAPSSAKIDKVHHSGLTSVLKGMRVADLIGHDLNQMWNTF